MRFRKLAGFRNHTSLGPNLCGFENPASLNLSTLNLQGFQNPASLGPNLCGFETLQVYETSQVWAQTCRVSEPCKFKLAGFRKVHKFGPKLAGFLNNSQLKLIGNLKKLRTVGQVLIVKTRGELYKILQE